MKLMHVPKFLMFSELVFYNGMGQQGIMSRGRVDK